MVRDVSEGANGANGHKPSVLIDLTAKLTPADYVNIDGKRYPIARVGSFGLLERGRMDRLAKRIGELEALDERGEAKPADAAEYEERVRELAGMILPTASSLAKVDLAQLTGLCTAFFVWLSKTSPLPRALIRMMPSAKPSPSRASRGSTAAS